MSGRLLRLVCAAAVAAGTALAPLPAAAGPAPAPSVAELLTDLQRRYRDAEKATEEYNGTRELLRRRQAEVRRLDAELARSRRSLSDSRGAAGRLAREQYRDSGTGLSPYLGLLLAPDARRALDQGHVIGRLAAQRATAVGRVAGAERKADELARRAHRALAAEAALAERQKEQRDDVRRRLGAVEELLASLSAGQIAALAALEGAGEQASQERFLASGALGTGGAPSADGARAVRFAVDQLGKPYEWGAEGPAAYDCSGLTARAWQRAGTPIPRTSQEQWARLARVPLDELRPGDLVVYFPEATHVALYLGDGLVVQAPRPGARVKVSPIAANPVLGAVRPDPGARPLAAYAPPELPAGAADGSDEGYGSAQAPAASATSLR
ncbi:C40 family peptidase [Streptomyces sp. SCSIO 75703]|uniref:C40 family peptidase n=1 Tax=unclassified Streptomyces TaxID=2593676 RepID=UPI0004C17B40|nr:MULTISPECIES: C40 family peptidase [unclassified Streptomyces]